MPKYDPNKVDPVESYWMDEEDALEKRGIDPNSVDQVEPVKLPTHKHSATLHRGQTKKSQTASFRKGGMVCREYAK